MTKVNKTYSLDFETVRILEEYCHASDNWDKTISRSKVVNDAIRWFLSGDENVAELIHSRESLVQRIQEYNLKLDSAESKESTPISRPWWRRLLLGQ